MSYTSITIIHIYIKKKILLEFKYKVAPHSANLKLFAFTIQITIAITNNVILYSDFYSFLIHFIVKICRNTKNYQSCDVHKIITLWYLNCPAHCDVVWTIYFGFHWSMMLYQCVLGYQKLLENPNDLQCTHNAANSKNNRNTFWKINIVKKNARNLMPSISHAHCRCDSIHILIIWYWLCWEWVPILRYRVI